MINKNKKKRILGLNFQACEEEKLENNEKKVTHFEAHDERGVTKIKIPGQKNMRKKSLINKNKKRRILGLNLCEI